jgi:chemotaxis protein CheZ
MTTAQPHPHAPASAPAASPEIFQQLGLITRQLHDTLQQLGVMPNLQQAAEGLPDVRARLSYIAKKTGEAADKVLNSVDQAKLELGSISAATGRITQPAGAATQAVAEVEACTARIDQHLTDIMLAQDFHDLTSQVVAKVVALASQLEESLVKLLLQAAPPEQAQKVEAIVLAGPVIDAAGRPDVVANQGEVDDLLASLGF